MLNYLLLVGVVGLYQYRMVELSTSVGAKFHQSAGEAARYLETVVNEQAINGWDFHRIDKFVAVERAGCGCLGFFLNLIGMPTERETTRYVATFRMPAGTSQVASASPPT